MSGGQISIKCGIVSLTILLYVPGCVGESVNVTCHPETICALRETEVNLTCSYSAANINSSFWFNTKQKEKWLEEKHPEDLALDPDYAGRVRYTVTANSTFSLTISDLRERDSGEYHLVLVTEGEKIISSSAVTLTVTDLQIKLKSSTLTCSTSCSLTPQPKHYVWYMNGQIVSKTDYSTLGTYTLFGNIGSFSCSVSSTNKTRSSPVCRSHSGCWNVTYTERRVCVLEGSSATFLCTYSHPRSLTVTQMFWHYLWPKDGPKDLSRQEPFETRVDNIGDKDGNCSLKMRDARRNDSGEYFYRVFTVNEHEKFSGKPGVILNVTGLQVRVSSTTSSEGQTLILGCSTSCTLPDNPTYIWYKNGQVVTNKPTKYNKLYLKCEDAGNYSCSVKGREDLRSPATTLTDHCGDTLKTWLIVGLPVCIALILIIAFLVFLVWRIRSKSTSSNGQSEMNSNVYEDFKAEGTSVAGGEAADDQDDVNYSSVHFQRSNDKTPSQPPTSQRSFETTNEEICYAAVNFNTKGGVIY